MYRQVWLIRGNEMHSEGDNRHCVPTESRGECSDQSGAEDGNLKDLQADTDKKKKKNFSVTLFNTACNLQGNFIV